MVVSGPPMVRGHRTLRPASLSRSLPACSAIVMLMRTPSHRRPGRRVIDTTCSADLPTLAESVTYVGSAEHKGYPSPAGPPRLRADATRCDRQLHGDFALLTGWLREAVVAGHVGGPWDGRFPRYAWARRGEECFEARLVNAESGQYKGYQLLDAEAPKGL
jgi:hypothetical protein